MSLAASLYAQVAAERRADHAASAVARQAFAVAVRLNPWNPAYRADHAWSLGAQGEAGSAREEMQQALRAAPADPHLWIEYARQRAGARRFDDEFSFALRRALALGPNAPPIHMTSARMGLRHWGFGDPDQQREWARSMAYALRRDPERFLRTVAFDRRENEFCSYAGLELGLADWCGAMRWMRQACERPERIREPALLQSCRSAGMPPRTPQP